MSVDDNSRLWKTIEHYERVKEYMKEKLDDISRQLEIFVCKSKRSRTQESRLTDKCRYQKKSQNTDQLENLEEKSFREANPLTDSLQNIE